MVGKPAHPLLVREIDLGRARKAPIKPEEGKHLIRELECGSARIIARVKDIAVPVFCKLGGAQLEQAFVAASNVFWVTTALDVRDVPHQGAIKPPHFGPS